METVAASHGSFVLGMSMASPEGEAVSGPDR